jgi:hypothetical protein
MLRFPRLQSAALILVLLAVAQRAHAAPEPLDELDKILFTSRNTIQLSPDKVGAIASFLQDKRYKNWRHDLYPRTANIRATGPFINHKSYTTHARVRMWYSPGVVDWMDHDRKGEIPEGQMIIKEMFGLDPAGVEDQTGWAAMIRDKHGSRDGWIWVIWFTSPALPPIAQYGMAFCLSCHTSTDNPEHTFASLGNLRGDQVTTYTYFNNPDPEISSPKTPPPLSPHQRFAAAANAPPVPTSVPPSSDPAPYCTSPVKEPKPLPSALLSDHVVSGPKGPDKFLTSDACGGCHDADYLLNEKMPLMTLPHSTSPSGPTEYLNLSQYGEWSGSLMGLSGRDPIFLAQLASERKLRPERADFISDFCFSCHSVMGQRQLHLDRGNQDFTRDMLTEEPASPDGKYGALARDGVSCAACHRVRPDGLGTPASFNARFVTGPPGEVYGPFQDPKVRAMKEGLAIEPRFGAQIGSSALCGSCHTVLTPRLPTPPSAQTVVLPPAHEQATYLEWLNSDFSNEPRPGPRARTCQGCHMQREIFGKPLAFEIANVEDGNFPQLDHRAKYEDITLQPRDAYGRHTLVGVNVFATEMFLQFWQAQGLVPDPFVALGAPFAPFVAGTPYGAPQLFPNLLLAAREQRKQATDASVTLRITGIARVQDRFDVRLEVENLAGHKVPSGVGFRRAFVALSVFDASGGVLWKSGRTSPSGVIVNERGQPLVSEFTSDRNQLQPNFSPQRPIMRQDQVQIYEERHVDDRGNLTTSFLGLFARVKDNRLLPAGWSPTGPYHEVTEPIALGGRPDPTVLPGRGQLVYEIPAAAVVGAKRVEAAIYYQSVPPYYLKDRFQIADEDTERLRYFVCHLETAGRGIEGWRLEIGRANAAWP